MNKKELIEKLKDFSDDTEIMFESTGLGGAYEHVDQIETQIIQDKKWDYQEKKVVVLTIKPQEY